MLVPQIGMARLRLDFFSINKNKRYMGTGAFYSYWASIKKPKGGGGVRGDLKGHIFLKGPGVIKNILLKKSLESLDLLLYRWKCWTKESFTPENSRKLRYTPWKFHIFASSSWTFYMHILFLKYTWKFHTFNTSYFFSGIAHCTCLNCYFSSFCKKLFKVFFVIVSSDVSRGSLCIPLPTPKENNM